MFFKPEVLKDYAQWVFYKKAFTEEECLKIQKFFTDYRQAEVAGGVRNSDIRKSDIKWLEYSEETFWIFQRITDFAFNCNNTRYKMDLTGFMEPLQLGRYSGGDHYAYHQDFGAGQFSIRKLSVVVQLSKPEEYEGGELQFQGFEDEKVVNGQGDLIIFPSFNPHRVTSITKGQRFSLVSWISGTPFR